MIDAGYYDEGFTPEEFMFELMRRIDEEERRPDPWGLKELGDG